MRLLNVTLLARLITGYCSEKAVVTEHRDGFQDPLAYDETAAGASLHMLGSIQCTTVGFTLTLTGCKLHVIYMEAKGKGLPLYMECFEINQLP